MGFGLRGRADPSRWLREAVGMASKGQSEGTEPPASEPPAAPLQSNSTFQWGAILAAVKDQLPSLDSDTSTSDSESDGELFIFQRKQPNLIPDLSEELLEFSLGDSNLQETEGCPWESWNEEVECSGFQKKTVGAQVVAKEDVPLIKDEISSLASHSGEIPSQKAAVNEKLLADSTDHLEDEELGRREAGEGGNSWFNAALSVEDLGSQKERRKLIETKILCKIPLELSPGHSELGVKSLLHGMENNLERIAKEEPSGNHLQELTRLSLQDIGKWDLDKEMEEQEEKARVEVALSSVDHETSRNRSENQLMEKLQELCARYSRTESPCCGWPAAKLSFEEEQEDKMDVALLSFSQSSQRMDTTFQCLPGPGTVYIDLRDTEPDKSVISPDEEQSASDSSTEEEETIKDLAERRTRNCSGKSLLLQQLRAAQKEASELRHKTSGAAEKLEGVKPDPESPDETGFSKISQKQYFKAKQETTKAIPGTLMRVKPEKRNGTLASHGDDGADIEKENKREDEKVQHSDAPESPLTATEWPRTEESKRELSQKEEQLKERQRFQEQLERLQPQQSVTGKQPMAEKTPVVFHMEASYLPDIDTLPGPESMKNEVLLMSIWLSSCGQVAPVQRKGQEPGVELREANIYQALVTWLLSLVPPVTVKAGPKAPFRVVGLQQAWQEDGLALYACLMPAAESSARNSTKIQKINAKEDLRRRSSFYQKISAFLARTRLLDVLWWRAELADRFQNQPCPLLPENPSVLLSSVTAVNPDPQAVEKVFAVPRGFYWQTVETEEECFPKSSDIQACRDPDTEVAMVLLFETLFRRPLATHHTLELVLGSGLDVCGLRLLYPQQDVLLSSSEKLPSSYTSSAGEVPPVLALGVRGPKARSTLQNLIGPSDPQLASVTDCGSINAIYCRSQEEPLLYLPHLDSRVHRELCLWFGGRAAGAAPWADVMDPASQRDSTASSRSPSSPGAKADEEKVGLQGMVLSPPPAMLVATTKGDVILVVSPLVPPHAYGDVISVCSRWGFLLQGVRRLQLSAEQALVLGMTTSQIAVFCPSEASSSPDSSAGGELSAEPRLHSLLLLLRKENAARHVPALVKGLMGELVKQGLLGSGQSSQPAPAACFHRAPYSEALMETLGGDLSAVPDPRNILLHLFWNRPYASEPEMEQVVTLAVVGMAAIKSAGDLLHQILLPGSNNSSQSTEGPDSGFELLGLKWLPRLTRCQAREITPFEVGDASWQRSLDVLMSNPVLVCVLRRIDAFRALGDALERLTQRREKLSTTESLLQAGMALTPEVTFRQAALFFTETDFVTDAEHRPAMKYLPPPGKRPRGQSQQSHAESIFSYLQAGAQILCTVLLIKPGVWSHNLVRILQKLDLEKFRVVGMKHINLEAGVASGLLPSEEKQDPAALEAHCSYLTSGTALVLCLQRPNAVKKLMDLLGPEDPKLAQAQDPFLWRAQYGTSAVQNGFYGSKSYQIAVRDVKLFFPEGLCGAECQTLEEEEIPNLKRDPIVGWEVSRQRRMRRRETGGRRGSLAPPMFDTLCQTTCLVLPGIILQGSEHPPYIELLDEIIGKDILVTGVRLTVLDAPQAHHVSKTLRRAKCSVAAKCSLLMDGLCLVLAVQRDSAVLYFSSLLESVCWQKELVLDTAQHLLYPQNEKQAEKLLCCLFDSLTSESIHQIESQDC